VEEQELERPLQAPRQSFTQRAALAATARLLHDAYAQELVASVDRIERTLFRYEARRNAEQQIHRYFDDLLNSPEGMFYYDEYKLRSYVDKMPECRTDGVLGMRADGRPVIHWKKKCNCLRLCPDEARQDQVRVIKQYVAAILAGKRAGLRLYKIVLSPPNVPRGDLHEAKRDLFRQWRAVCRMMQHKEVALQGIKGQLVIEEDPMGARGDWNVHLNIILLYDGWLDYTKFRELWPHQCDIKSEADMRKATIATLKKRGVDTSELTDEEILVHAVKECVKYPVQAVSEKSQVHADAASGWVLDEYQDKDGKPTAPPMTDWPEPAAMEWWDANKAFRRVRSYGCLYDCKRPQISDDDLDKHTTWIARIHYFESSGYVVSLPWLGENALALLGSIRRGTSRQKYDGDKPPTGPPPDPWVLAKTIQEAALKHYVDQYGDQYQEIRSSQERKGWGALFRQVFTPWAAPPDTLK
jgi:hypothetical protein